MMMSKEETWNLMLATTRFRKCLHPKEWSDLDRNELNPWFIGPSEILEKVGPVAYRLALPPDLANVHNVFHVLMFDRKELNPWFLLLFCFESVLPQVSSVVLVSFFLGVLCILF
uniref:Putative DNA/RNA polymerases superfamily protein n=1 Tax=Davidia involucrata TaxID=16924 RepID=A0A5B7BI21_DAVIN